MYGHNDAVLERRTWSKHIRTSLHALDPTSDPQDIDESQYNYQSEDPANSAKRYRQDGHGGSGDGSGVGTGGCWTTTTTRAVGRVVVAAVVVERMNR